MSEKREMLVPIGDLKIGMTVARDIFTRNEQLLIASGTVLDEGGIAKITFFGIMSIYISVEGETEALEETISPAKASRDMAMKKFNNRHERGVNFLSEKMNQLIKAGEEIDEEVLVEEVDTILEVASNRYQVFDLLDNIQAYDDETYSHSLNVGLICNVFGDWLNMSVDEKRNLTLAGLLHDIGKLLIDKEVLTKPGRLTEEEYNIIKGHPLKGYDFLKDKKICESVKWAALQHHERSDGTGYPNGISANQINPYAVIASIADVFEAMTAKRVYREAICPFKVVRIFEEEGKKDFNPIFLIPILRKLTEAYLQQTVVLNDGQQGKLILIHDQELSRPSVLCGDQLLDLRQHRKLEIVKIIT